MKLKLLLPVVLSATFIGCASVPMESQDASMKAKQFAAPAAGKSGLYIYRSSGPGAALTKDIWIDDECVGKSAQNVFFYEQVDGDMQHKVTTASEFSPNDLLVNTKSGKNYFVQQYIKMGVFVGGANLRLVDEEKGKVSVSKLELASKGGCNEK